MKRTVDLCWKTASWLSGMLVSASVLFLIGFLLWQGGHAVSPALFFGDTPWQDALLGRKPVFDGIWPAIVGTLSLVVLASLLAVPIGIAAGIYLSEYATARQRRWIGSLVDLLSATPSIVMGLFGFTLILLLRKTMFPGAQTGLMPAAACIALIVLPYLIATTQASLQGIPEESRLLGASLGLTKWQHIRHTLIPLSAKGILGGVVLAIGRAAEDTAVILLTGVMARAGMPRNLWDKFEALPFHVYYLAAEHRDAAELAQGFGTALVLLMVTTSLFGISYWIERRTAKRWEIG
ncbi:phosphate ABC transporter permease PstA [Desulfatirhabdium butyrativorans]|uniref:phosphate ABC transporter permease PstA n=1 Tax=Desulfatirhabdium butyrativorans TaxID=340467 RepID=UPI0004864A40|nr:phosphate ABC transporter permease PstA [Desulfatirhabdium butyrativorans]